MKPLKYFVQNDAVDQLADAFGDHLQDLERDHQLCVIQALTLAMLTGGSFIDCLIDSNAYIEESFPDVLWEIAEEIDRLPELTPLLEAVVHQLANPVQVVAAGAIQ